jgi:hypothetical protein
MNMKSVIVSAVAFVAVSAAAQAGPSEALAFAIGQCSSQPDEKARLACYDRIAEQLKTGTFLATQAPESSASPPPFVQLPTPGSSAQPPAAVAQAPAPVAPAPVAVPAQMAQSPAPKQDSGTWYDPTSWFGKDNPRATSDKPADFGSETMPQTTSAAGEPAEPAPLDEIRATVTAATYTRDGHFTVTLGNGQVWQQIEGDTGVARFKNKGGDVVTISRGVLGSYNLVVEGHNLLFKVRRLR